MGLDTTHDCWHGAYSAFMRWRVGLAKAAGLPPLGLMDGYYKRGDVEASAEIKAELPIRWDTWKDDVLVQLLYHSDCEGSLPAAICGPLADRLEQLLPALGMEGDGGGHLGSYVAKTQTFIDGLRRASAAGEDVEFH